MGAPSLAASLFPVSKGDMSSSSHLRRREFLRTSVAAAAAPFMGGLLSLTGCDTSPQRQPLTAYHRHSAEQTGPTRTLRIAVEVADVQSGTTTCELGTRRPGFW